MVRTRSYFTAFTVLAAMMALLCAMATSSGAAAGDMTLISRDNSGAQGDGASRMADISSDGRFVAFSSSATNLVPNDTSGGSDVFVRDLRPAANQTTTIERVSVGPAGVQAENGVSDSPTISADGRYVAFVSNATNLVPNDTNGKSDVFVHDRETGANVRVNVSDSGDQANETSSAFPAPSISDDGRYVAFLSSASNLVPNDNIIQDVFVHDRDKDGDNIMDEAGQIRTENLSRGNGSAYGHSMSTDGRYVAFYSGSSTLVAGDTDRTDMFVRDRQTGTLQRIRMDCSFSLCATHLRRLSSISDNGRYVAFQADATSVLTGNDNGLDSLDDVFVYDRQTGTTQRVGVNNCGTPANGVLPESFSISSDGHYLAFTSDATNLVGKDTNNHGDVFVRDLKPDPNQTVTIERVSVGPAGVQANGSSSSPSISSDGRYVAFTSSASNLVEGDTNNHGDVFVYERGVATNPSECIAPSTTVNALTGSDDAPYTSGAWTDEFVEVSFSALDNEGGSGLKDISFSATGAQSIPQTLYDPQDPPVIVVDGTTTISYFATDNAGNEEEPKTFTVKIDKSAPETTITSGPSGYVRSTSAELSYSSSELDSTFQCKRDDSTFAACPLLSQSYSSLSQGTHIFRVRAIDKAGKVDASPASRSWFVDTVVPTGTISINGGASSTSSRSVTLSLSASDPSPASGVAYMRFRNGGTTTWSSWVAYSTSKSWTLTSGVGTKTVYVQYRDRARNISAAASDTIRFNP